jgi:hypothetical protein
MCISLEGGSIRIYSIKDSHKQRQHPTKTSTTGFRSLIKHKSYNMPSTNQDAAASSSATVRQADRDKLKKSFQELQEMNNRLSEAQELESQSHRDMGEDEATVRRIPEASDKGVEENLNYQLERLEQKKELQMQMDKASEGIIRNNTSSSSRPGYVFCPVKVAYAEAGAFDKQPRELPILCRPPVDGKPLECHPDCHILAKVFPRNKCLRVRMVDMETIHRRRMNTIQRVMGSVCGWQKLDVHVGTTGL